MLHYMCFLGCICLNQGNVDLDEEQQFQLNADAITASQRFAADVGLRGCILWELAESSANRLNTLHNQWALRALWTRDTEIIVRCEIGDFRSGRDY